MWGQKIKPVIPASRMRSNRSLHPASLRYIPNNLQSKSACTEEKKYRADEIHGLGERCW